MAGNHFEAMSFVKKSKKLYTKESDREGQVSAWLLLARCHLAAKNHEEAQSSCREAHALCEETKNYQQEIEASRGKTAQCKTAALQYRNTKPNCETFEISGIGRLSFLLFLLLLTIDVYWNTMYTAPHVDPLRLSNIPFCSNHTSDMLILLHGFAYVFFTWHLTPCGAFPFLGHLNTLAQLCRCGNKWWSCIWPLATMRQHCKLRRSVWRWRRGTKPQ